MKIPGLSGPVSEKTPGENAVRANSPAAGKNAAAASVNASNSNSLKSETSQLSQFSQAALFKALGLPADRLSASIVSFAKFFSLPLEPSLMANVRRLTAGVAAGQQVPAGQPRAADLTAAAAGSDAPARAREALSLAALAAADKGVELTPQALEEYAAAVDPDSRGSGQGRQDGENSGQDARGKKREAADDVELAALSGERLKEQFSCAAEPLLDTLNQLPGKNGQRWLVFPLDFTENGADFRVTLRLLLDGAIAGSAGSVRRMSLEIAESGGVGADRRRLFIMDRDARGDSGAQYRLTLLVDPPQRQGSLKALAEKLARFMGLSADRVTAGNFGGDSCAPDSRDFLPDSVNTEA